MRILTPGHRPAASLKPILVAAALTLAAGLASASPIEPASMLVFPYVTSAIDAAADTFVQIANVSDAPVLVDCMYEDTTPSCSAEQGLPCVPPGDARHCDEESCDIGSTRSQFFLRLTAGQPLGWWVASGRNAFPLEAERTGPDGSRNSGNLVPAVADPFVGILRCVAREDDQSISLRNPLIGTAALHEGAVAEAGESTVGTYNAVGLPALRPAAADDDLLVMGGASAEFAGCPHLLEFPHVFDDATLRTGEARSDVHTTLALAPCAPSNRSPTAQFLVSNEFAQRFSTAAPLGDQLVRRLSAIDTIAPVRSVFGVGVQGTLTGKASVAAVSTDGQHGIAGVTIERHTFPFGTTRIAAMNIAGVSFGSDPDYAAWRLPQCVGDCDANGFVTIDELVTGVNIAMGAASARSCIAFDPSANNATTVDEIIGGLTMALQGCEVSEPGPLPVRPEPTPRTLPTPGPVSGGVITALAVVAADGTILEPEGEDEMGRPIFVRHTGHGFMLVVEGWGGRASTQVGQVTYDPNDLTSPPDLQLLVSRDLGNGDTRVCDIERSSPGGVPGVPSLAFDGAPAAVAAMHDLGCRAVVRIPQSDSCARDAETRRSTRIAAGSIRQFCIPIVAPWAFPEGDTIVAARIEDIYDQPGEPEEIVVRVAP